MEITIDKECMEVMAKGYILEGMEAHADYPT